jgi:hypothetical protein
MPYLPALAGHLPVRTQGGILSADLFDREAALAAITRYSLYPVMYYRTNLLIHSHRTSWIVRTLNRSAPRIFGDYDPQRAEMIARVYDDPELIMGDFQAGNKLLMTPEELAVLEATKLQAIDQVAERMPAEMGGYNYRELLLEGAAAKTPEAMVNQWADKFDAFGEALHEVFAGNLVFATNVVNERGTIPTPVEYYLGWFAGFRTKFPGMAPLLDAGIGLLQPFPPLDHEHMARLGRLHTQASLRRPSGYWPYDAWRHMTRTHATPEQLAALWTPVAQ